ncbi:MAG: iron-containing redox enzyme family protein [Pseudomonadota bacterium]
MISELNARFEPILIDFLSSPPVKSVTDKTMTVEEYRSILRQVFHHTRENPQLQALATVYFRGRDRDLVKLFFKHAASEIGHDQLALNDYVTLGGDPTNVPYENPLPSTSALLAFGFYQIYNLNPLGYLGYLYFLEAMPVQSGEGLMGNLRDIGIPDSAMTFLLDHTTIDVGHTKMMEKYVATLVKDEKDLDCIEYAMKTVAHLYSQMMAQAIADVHKPMAVGWNWEELNADRTSPQENQSQVA